MAKITNLLATKKGRIPRIPPCEYKPNYVFRFSYDLVHRQNVYYVREVIDENTGELIKTEKDFSLTIKFPYLNKQYNFTNYIDNTDGDSSRELVLSLLKKIPDDIKIPKKFENIDLKVVRIEARIGVIHTRDWPSYPTNGEINLLLGKYNVNPELIVTGEMIPID